MPMKPPKLSTAWATLPLILSIITRSSLPIFFSSVPYTAVPSTLSLPIKETVSLDSRVDAVVMRVSFHGVTLGAPATISQNANGVSDEGQGKFRKGTNTTGRCLGVWTFYQIGPATGFYSPCHPAI